MNTKNKGHNSVHILPKEVASQIAAGEVVERPASVVKELIENSIDAGAQLIQVEVKNGGKSLIKVIDNGIGMNKSDLELCVKPHATSKILTIEDLEHIYTFGFRGEALSSIASVSRLTITTRQKQSDSGWRIQVEFGREKEIAAVGAPVGTQVSVEDLFLEIPARRKFLKRDSTELSHIAHVVRLFATAHPEIRFELISSNREIFRSLLEPKGPFIVTPLLGQEIASKLIEVTLQTDDVTIWGYISPPDETRFNTKNFYFFINRRPIKNPLLWRATMDAYKGFIQKGAYPLGVIFIDVNPSFVDVNVHPTKQEVRFDEPDRFYKMLYHSIKERLELFSQEVFLVSDDKGDEENKEGEIEVKDNILNDNGDKGLKSDILEDIGFFKKEIDPIKKDGISPSNSNQIDNLLKGYNRKIESFLLEPSTLKETSIGNLKDIEILGQLDNSFIICTCKKGLYLIDQHAAHEAILFKRIFTQIKNNQVVKQQLLMPEVLEYPLNLIARLDEAKDVFKKVGLDVSDFGQGHIIVHSVPHILIKDKAIKDSIKKLLDLILENPHLSEELLLREIAASLACHSAIKAGQKLHQEEIKKLLEKIVQERVHHCPHGRPIALKLDLNDLYKSFKR